MTNITFSVDDELHKKMKNHPEIKWTEILRQSIANYLKKVEEIDVLSIKDFRKRLDPEIQKKIEELNEQDETSFYEEAKKIEEERLKRLQELERSVDE
jgi:tetrahydromethanopterin S-methyltransferase subunit A